MKTILAIFVLTASLAWSQAKYAITNFVSTTSDVTTQTVTLNQWKADSRSQVCQLGTLASGSRDGSVWCRESNGYWYKFNSGTHKWEQQTAMGTSIVALVVQGATNIYGLENTGGIDSCGTAGGFHFLSFSHWSGSSWTGVHGCFYSAPTVGYDGFMAGIGWDSSTNVLALYSSQDNASSWQLWADNTIYVNMNSTNDGCGISSTNAMYRLDFGNPDDAFPALPSGTPAGCTVALMPTVVVAWNTAGKVYAMPLENFGTWQSVTGITANQVAGTGRQRIMALDTSGKPYHWNINVPTVSATWGGTWGGGCPTASQPCSTGTNKPTHTLTHQIKFQAGGMSGQKYTATQNWDTNFSVTAQDTGLGCDPFFGDPTDPSCSIDESYAADCNASDTQLQQQIPQWEINNTTDVMAWTGNKDSFGPTNVRTGPNSGYVVGQVDNWIRDACAVGDPVPACPVNTDVPITIHNEQDWFGPPSEQLVALAKWNLDQDQHISGVSSPYVVHGFYIAQRLPGGSLVLQQCFGGWIGDQDFLYGNIDEAPPCE